MRSPRDYQLRTIHLVVAMSIFGLMAALIAPLIRVLPEQRQLLVLSALGGIFVVCLGMIWALFLFRRQSERLAGPLIAVVNRAHARPVRFALLAGCLLLLGTAAWSSIERAFETSSIFPLLNPHLLMWCYFSVSYGIVKVWWGIDVMTLELREAGILTGGFNLIPWKSITRYTISGTPPRQLNLFCNATGIGAVINLSVEPRAVSTLSEVIDCQLEAVRQAEDC